MPQYISQEDIQMYSHLSIDEKDLDQFGKLLLQICDSTRILITNGVSLWPNINCFRVENTMEIM